MENWGLITYGEESLCINPETSPSPNILLIANIISHELAHQVKCGLIFKIFTAAQCRLFRGIHTSVFNSPAGA